ncbi:glutathione S-transferase [Chitinivorax tropicus]|uniref:Glutathione S-transferase n=1 Tax=Chitinivorax tropicus TaxID=714531 RepID=A0A840MJP7_9PROT|nr:glutathione S-transferase family protein [Chitinivorax tropicus]MBB5017047.1 glutathione S-transferase [Chitinivorax tropicus]
MLKGYGMSLSGNCYKVKLALTQLGLPFEWHEVDLRGGEQRTSQFLRMNPNGKVPVLQIDEQTFLPESNAILYYLGQGTPLMPQSKLEQAQVMQWLFFEQYSHEPYIAVARFIVKLAGRPASREQELQNCIVNGYKALDVMEQHLARHNFFVSNQYSIADIALYAYTHKAEDGGFSLDNYPAIRAWMSRVTQQPKHIPM